MVLNEKLTKNWKLRGLKLRGLIKSVLVPNKVLDNHSVVITRFRDSTTFIPNGSFKALMRRFNTWHRHMIVTF